MLCKKWRSFGRSYNNTVKVFSMETKALIAEFKNGHKKQILSIDISQDSLLLASGGKDSTITIWDFTDNKILSTLSYHKGIVTSVKFSPDGRYLVSGATDDKVYLYDIAQKKVVKEYTGHTDDVTSVDFSLAENCSLQQAPMNRSEFILLKTIIIMYPLKDIKAGSGIFHSLKTLRNLYPAVMIQR